MRHHEEDGFPIVQRSFDLCVGLYGHVNRFPRLDALRAVSCPLPRVFSAWERGG